MHEPGGLEADGDGDAKRSEGGGAEKAPGWR